MYDDIYSLIPEEYWPVEVIPFVRFWNYIDHSELNLESGNLTYIRGNFFISKKNTKCFKIDEDHGEHMLLCDEWGGPFVDYRGNTIIGLKDSLYEKRASSNGRGKGMDYAIVPYGWTNVISIDDI